MIMEEWKEYKLGDVANVKGGKRLPKGINLTTIANTHPYIRVRDLGTKKILELDSSYEYVDDETQKSISKYIVNSGDIILSIVGTIGLVAVIGTTLDGANLTENCVKLINVNKIDKEYLYYYLSSDIGKSEIEKGTVGAVQAKLPIKNIQSINIKAPAIELQKRIASILKSLDDKIEVNRRINKNLEQQAQALFKSWFVDFEPFKDQPFVESELGMIPQGLQTKYISEIPHILETGRRPKGGVGELTHGIPSVGAEHVKGMGNYDYSKTKFISEEYAATLKTGKVKGYELLIYKDGGKPGYFIPNYSIFGDGYPFEDCYLNEHVFKLDFNDRGFNAFCYFYFRTDYVMNYLNAQGGKAAIPGINRQDIENILIYGPDNELVKKFGEYVLPMIKKMLINCKESRRLAELRDTLLPRLMSGEINVNDVQMAISE